MYCFIAAGSIYLTALAFAWWVLSLAPVRLSRILDIVGTEPPPFLPFKTLWRYARAGKLRPGDEAPDFNLPLLDRSGAVQLSSLKGKRPVVLVFGSYT